MKNIHFFKIFNKLRVLFPRKYKILLVIVFIMTILLSVIETLGITLIMPFISIATDPSLIDKGMYQKVYDFLKFNDKILFTIAFGFFVIVFYFFRAAYNIGYTYFTGRFSAAVGRYFSSRLFKTTLMLPYKVYVQKNSAELINIINNQTGAINGLINSMMGFFAELFVVILLYIFILFADLKITLVLTAIIILIVSFIFKVILKKSKQLGIKVTEFDQKLSRTLGESLGNLKFVKIKGSEEESLSKYETFYKAKFRAGILNGTLGTVPRMLLETTGFVLLIATIIFILWKDRSPERIIPLIAMYTVTLYRLLPSVTRVMNYIHSVVSSQGALDIVERNLSQETENDGNAPISFNKSITINDIAFKYLTGKKVLENISLEIKKGEKIAITGESGGGKSTLADLIIGVNKPVSGVIYIDGIAITNDNIRAWRRKIGYIPQSIYLYDGTVGENVAFGSTFNEERIIEVLKLANIWDYLSEKDGINSKVGEGGVQLSGGQKQRIGIARALYDDPEVLVLDEATSALDTETETRIMDEIYKIGADKTLIIIAHRLSTIERCSRCFLVKKGKITEK